MTLNYNPAVSKNLKETILSGGQMIPADVSDFFQPVIVVNNEGTVTGQTATNSGVTTGSIATNFTVPANKKWRIIGYNTNISIDTLDALQLSILPDGVTNRYSNSIQPIATFTEIGELLVSTFILRSKAVVTLRTYVTSAGGTTVSQRLLYEEFDAY